MLICPDKFLPVWPRGKTKMVAPALKYESNWTESFILWFTYLNHSATKVWGIWFFLAQMTMAFKLWKRAKSENFSQYFCPWLHVDRMNHIILQVFSFQPWMYCCAQSYASGLFICFWRFKSIVAFACLHSEFPIESLWSSPPSRARTHTHTFTHTHTHLLLISIMDGDKVNVFFEWLSLYLSSCYIFLGSLKFPGYPAFIRILAHKY